MHSESLSSWREEDGAIRFSVTSDGATGEEWIARLRAKKYKVTRDAARLLMYRTDPRFVVVPRGFRPTCGVTTEVSILKGSSFKRKDRNEGKLYAEASYRGLALTHIEVACLIRNKFTNADIDSMGFHSINVMHEPILHQFGTSSMLFMTSRSIFSAVIPGTVESPFYSDQGFAYSATKV